MSEVHAIEPSWFAVEMQQLSQIAVNGRIQEHVATYHTATNVKSRLRKHITS